MWLFVPEGFCLDVFCEVVCADVGGWVLCALAWIEISRLIKLRSGAPTDNSFAQMIVRGEREREGGLRKLRRVLLD